MSLSHHPNNFCPARINIFADIILSPLRPQQRNITPEDIKSALYLIYLSNPSDDLNAPGPVRDETSWRSSEDGGSSPLTIPRKPLPGSARPLTPDSLPNENRLYQQSSDSDVGTPPTTTAALGNAQGAASAANTADMLERTSAGLHTGMPARKPVGPRPMAAPAAVPSAAAPVVPKHCSVLREGIDDVPNYQVKPISIPPLDTSVPPVSVDNSHAQDYPVLPRPVQQPQSRSPSPQRRSVASAGTPFILNLVRIDASSGNSLNVGRIYSRQVDSLQDNADPGLNFLSTSAPMAAPVSLRHPPIDIDLETSGYAQFRGTSCRKGSLTEGGGLEAAAAAMARQSLDGRSQMKGDIAVFSRQVAMGYSKSFATNVKEKSREAWQFLEQAGRSAINRHRSDSVASMASNKSDTPAIPDTIVTSGPPPEGMKARGYTFTSPWDGKCVFITGKDGRSIECQHTPHESPNGAYTNELVNSRHSHSGGQTVSELRFNLPTFSDQANTSKEQRFREQVRKLHIQASGGNDSDFCDDDYDTTNIGSEHAGGGRNGRQAKLGKLIVHDEGQKMLDLVVAANIGVWWASWEKFS